uniref:Uncharacterized protein n=1 Tax=Arundo donax TaxID=35708 RepID=A0A0A9HNX0_ARUDO
MPLPPSLDSLPIKAENWRAASPLPVPKPPSLHSPSIKLAMSMSLPSNQRARRSIQRVSLEAEWLSTGTRRSNLGTFFFILLMR